MSMQKTRTIRRTRFMTNRLEQLLNQLGTPSLEIHNIRENLHREEYHSLRQEIQQSSVDEIIKNAAFISRVNQDKRV